MTSNDDSRGDDQRAWQLIRDGKKAEAERILRNLVAKQPGEWIPAHELAVLLVDLGPAHYEEARHFADLALDLVRQLPRPEERDLRYAHSVCADIAMRQRRFKDAAHHYEQAVEQSRALAEQNRDEEGLLRDFGPEWMALARYYAWFWAAALRSLGEHERAAEALDTALDFDGWGGKGIKPFRTMRAMLVAAPGGAGPYGVVAFWTSRWLLRFLGFALLVAFLVALAGLVWAGFCASVSWPPMAAVAVLAFAALCFPLLRKVWLTGVGGFETAFQIPAEMRFREPDQVEPQAGQAGGRP